MKILSVGFWIATIVYAIAIDLVAGFIPGLDTYLSPRGGMSQSPSSYTFSLGVSGHSGIVIGIALAMAWFTPRLF
ncbi:MAG: hypothetical protein CMP81_00010 [Fulvimarina sp.]|nr:hypothetical protein [Fulvimarina sp.]